MDADEQLHTDPAETLRAMARGFGLDDAGEVPLVVRRLRRHIARESSRTLAPRAWRRAEKNFGKPGRKGAKARARGMRVLRRKFGRVR